MNKTVKRCSNILMAAIVAVTSVSCVKDRLFHTPHLDKGAVVFTADFSRRPELVESVTGRLGGVAAAFDIASQSIIGDAAAIKVVFARSGDRLTADVRLLGIVGKDQTLTLEVAFTDRERRKTAEVSLSEAFASYYENTQTGLEINGDLATPVGADATATITGWKDVEGDHADAT